MRTRFKLGMALGVIAAVGLAAAQPVSAAIVNGGFEGFPDFTGFTTAGNATIQASDFRTPVEGVQQAVLSTAPGAVTGGSNPISASALETFVGLGSGSLTGQGAVNGSGVKQTSINVVAGDIVTFKYDFYTQEQKPTTSNDFAFISVNGVLTKLTSVNTATLGAPPAFNGGTGDNAGINSFAGVTETGFQSFTIGALQGLIVGNNAISFGVVNVGNSLVQSGLIVDAIVQAPGGANGGGPGGGGGGGVPLPAGVYLMTLGLATAGAFSSKLRRLA